MHAANSDCSQGCKAWLQMKLVELQLSDKKNDNRDVCHSMFKVRRDQKVEICWNYDYNQIGLGDNLSLPVSSLVHQGFNSLGFWTNAVIDLSTHGLHKSKAGKNHPIKSCGVERSPL